MHMQGHIRVFLDKAPDHRRQRITRLGVGGRDAQVAFTLVTELLGDFLDAFDPTQDLPCLPDDDLAAGSNASQVLAAAGKHLKPQLVLEQTNLFGNARL